MERQRFGAGCLYGGALVGDEYTDRDKRELSFVVSTDHPHRNGNVVHSAGIRFEAFDKNPLLLLSHDAGEKSPKALPLGKWIKRAAVTLPDGVPGVIMRARYLDEETFGGTGETYQLALAVYLMALDGMLNATSIGWLGVDDRPPRRRRTGGLEFDACELVEVSQALIPANPNALRVEASMGREVLSLGVKRGVLKADQAELLGRYVGNTAVYDIASIGGDMTGVRVASEWTALGREAAVGGQTQHAAEITPGDPPVGDPPEPVPAEPPAPVDPPAEENEEDEVPDLGGEAALEGPPVTAALYFDRKLFRSRDVATRFAKAHGLDPSKVGLLGGSFVWQGANPGKLIGLRTVCAADGVTALIGWPGAPAAPAAPAKGGSAVVAGRTSAAASPLARFVAMAGSAELDTAWARTMASCQALAMQLAAVGFCVGADSHPYDQSTGGVGEDIQQESAARKTQTALNLAEDVVTNLSSMAELLAYGPVAGEGATPAEASEVVAPATPTEADTIAALGKLHGLIKATLTPDPPADPPADPPEPEPAPAPEPSSYTAAFTALHETLRQRFADDGEREKAA